MSMLWSVTPQATRGSSSGDDDNTTHADAHGRSSPQTPNVTHAEGRPHPRYLWLSRRDPLISPYWDKVNYVDVGPHRATPWLRDAAGRIGGRQQHHQHEAATAQWRQAAEPSEQQHHARALRAHYN